MLSFKGLADLDGREWFEQLPLIVLVSVAAGVLGALFNTAHKHILKARARPPPPCMHVLTALLDHLCR